MYAVMNGLARIDDRSFSLRNNVMENLVPLLQITWSISPEQFDFYVTANVETSTYGVHETYEFRIV